MSFFSTLAATIPISPNGGFRGQGPLGLEGQTNEASVPIFNQVISTTIGVISAIAFIFFTINVLLGAFSILTAGSDKNKVAEARKKITNNVLGVVLVVAAVFIAELVGTILGVDVLRGAFVVPFLAN